MGLTKGLKQIAADFISLLGKDKAHRGTRRDGRAPSDMRSSRVRSARCIADAPVSGFLSPPPPHSSLPHMPDLGPEFALFREALSDDGARFATQPPQPSASAEKSRHVSSGTSTTAPHGGTRCSSPTASFAQPNAASSMASTPASASPTAVDPAQSVASHRGHSPPVAGAALSSYAPSHANTEPVSAPVDPGPGSAPSEDQPQLSRRQPVTFPTTIPAAISVELIADCNAATSAAKAAAAAATGGDAAGRPAGPQNASLLPSPLAATATASAAATITPLLTPPSPPLLQPAVALRGVSSPSVPYTAGLEMAPSSPVSIARNRSGASLAPAPAPAAGIARLLQHDRGVTPPPAVAGSGASASATPAPASSGCCAAAAARPTPPVGQVYTSPSLAAGMRRATESWSTDDFEIGKKIHKGYSSSVYRACCLYSGSDVVLKAYNLAGLSTFLRNQVLRELDIHSRLKHPGVVHLMAAFREEDNLVLVLEYVRGGSLDRVRRKLGGRMTEFQAMHLVLLPLLGVLAHLHERGIVHRDIKPDNLLFTDDWKLKVCDFGVSICLPEERAVTRTGTREYLAPEVDRCPPKRLPEDNKDNPELSYGTAVDVWSLGSLMYELLVGFTPFPGGPPARREGARGSAGARLAFPGGISQEARAFVRSCLELDPMDRPTVHQLMEHAWVQEALIAAEALIAPPVAK